MMKWTSSTIVAFASEVLISALALNLMDEALQTGGFALSAGDFPGAVA